MQPAMSTIFAIRDGLKDAREGRSPYFWTVLTAPEERSARLREAIKATGKIIILALILDTAYQVIELGAFYPLEAIIVAVVLAFIPYLLIRGPAAYRALVERQLGLGWRTVMACGADRRSTRSQRACPGQRS